MSLFKCLCLGIIAILLCGCGESRAEFSPLNLGKVNVVYENQTLKIAESRANSACGDFSGSASARFVNEPKSSISSLASHNPKNSSTILEFASCKKNAESSLDSAPKDNAPFILFFFTSTCGVCKAQIPILEQLSAQGIKIYAILGDVPDISKASAFASAHKISLPLFYESGARRFFTRAVGGVKGVPVMAVFNNGKMKEKFIGLTPKSTLLRAI